MNTRTTHRTVTFRQPFSVAGIAEVQPPGAYEVATDEETIDNLSFLAWRRVATSIQLHSGGATQVHRIDPTALEASLLRDAGMTILPAGE